MTDQFVAEIRLVPFTFAPRGWAFCQGQLMSISQNTALFALLGTTYGGDGKSTFALPDLQGSSPVQAGQGAGLSPYDLGQQGGVESVGLLPSEIPAHTHPVSAVNATGTQNTADGAFLATPRVGRVKEATYSSTAGAPQLPLAVASVGGDQPHDNMPPYLALNYIIALEGVFPQRP